MLGSVDVWPMAKLHFRTVGSNSNELAGLLDSVNSEELSLGEVTILRLVAVSLRL